MNKLDRLKNFGMFISKSREKLKLSQEELGKRAGMTRQAIYQIETAKNKNIYVDTLIALSTVLKVSPAKLIAVYKGEDPELLEDTQQLESAVADFLEHLPVRLLRQIRCEDRA